MLSHIIKKLIVQVFFLIWWFLLIFKTLIFTFTFMYLADAFIHFLVSMCVPWELNPQPLALLTQCSTTESQEQLIFRLLFLLFYYLLLLKTIFYLELFFLCIFSLWWKASILQYFFPLWFNNLIYGMDYQWLLSNRDIQNMQAQRCLSVWVTQNWIRDVQTLVLHVYSISFYFYHLLGPFILQLTAIFCHILARYTSFLSVQSRTGALEWRASREDLVRSYVNMGFLSNYNPSMQNTRGETLLLPEKRL